MIIRLELKMRYYLSYVEIYYRGAGPFPHPALMLSTQSNESAPAKVVVETGFGYHRIDDSNHFYPHLRPGAILEEKIAQRAVAGKHTLYHRTYELSSAEAEHFIKIMDRDKQRSDENIEYFDSTLTPMVSEFKYHIITHNCKVYALGVLKELGIVEASELSNFFIQIPGTHHSLLQRLSDKDLSSPTREALVEKITSTLTQFKANIKNEEPNYKDFKPLMSINTILHLSGLLSKFAEKARVDEHFLHKLEKIGSLLADLTQPYTDVEKKSDLEQKLKEMQEDTHTLINLSKENKLSFIWKQPPSLAKRQVLTNFTPEEKVLYIIKTKTREISDQLQNIVSSLNKHICSNHLNHQLSQDLMGLKKITEAIKKRLDEQDQLFLDSINKLIEESKSGKSIVDSDLLILQCVNQGKRLNDILNHFDQAVSGFTPRIQETSVVIRWIKVILSYIKSDFFTIENAQAFIKAKISSAKKENEHLDSKIKISNPGFFKRYCDIDRSAFTTHTCTRSPH